MPFVTITLSGTASLRSISVSFPDRMATFTAAADSYPGSAFSVEVWSVSCAKDADGAIIADAKITSMTFRIGNSPSVAVQAESACGSSAEIQWNSRMTMLRTSSISKLLLQIAETPS